MLQWRSFRESYFVTEKCDPFCRETPYLFGERLRQRLPCQPREVESEPLRHRSLFRVELGDDSAAGRRVRREHGRGVDDLVSRNIRTSALATWSGLLRQVSRASSLTLTGFPPKNPDSLAKKAKRNLFLILSNQGVIQLKKKLT